MKMIILNEEQVNQLEVINSENVNLNRAIKALKLDEDKHGVGIDILTDQITWANWIEFLQDKPVEDVEIPVVSEEDAQNSIE
jgi:hypothetical protein